MRGMNMNQQAGTMGVNARMFATDSQMQAGGGFYGAGNGQQGGGNADCLLLSNLPDGSIVLDAEAAAGLIYMIEEEKMARDLYDGFYTQTGSVVFDRISNSEQRHMDTLLAVAENAGIDTSGISTTPGVFTNPDIQTLYNSLLAQGAVSTDAAYEVGVLVEQTDIADLQEYTEDAGIGIIGTVYSHLEAGSEHHLAAFSQYADLV